jgi:sulfatase maturation enzyme AslB (radical SAM superfamily)
MDTDVNGNSYPDYSLIKHTTPETDNNIPRTELFDSIVALNQTDQLDHFPDYIKPTSLAIDIINQCNLTCEHCFWVKQKDSVLTTRNNKILDSVRQAIEKYPSINNILWYGGELLMAKRLLLEGFKILGKNNTVITNGSIPLPSWHDKYNVRFSVSIDGTGLLHNKIRGEGSYQKTKLNVINALQKKIPIYILYCINSKNINNIDIFLKEWANENIKKNLLFMFLNIMIFRPRII